VYTLYRLAGRPCKIIRRANRFVVEVEQGGARRRAYINNTGRLREYLVEGRTGYCHPHRRPGRTELRLFAVEDAGAAALIDTQYQMRALEVAVERGLIPWLRGCRVARRNPRLGSSVLDYLLDCPGGQLYVEVKSAALRSGDYAAYPDCPTLRGRRHIRELIENRGRTALVFIAAIPGAKAFTPYEQGDPLVAELIAEAAQAGVIVKAIGLYYDPRSGAVVLYSPDLPVVLSGRAATS